MCQLRLVSAEEDAKLYQGNNAILTSRLADAATEQEHLQRQIAGLQDELQQMRSVLNDEQSAVQVRPIPQNHKATSVCSQQVIKALFSAFSS